MESTLRDQIITKIEGKLNKITSDRVQIKDYNQIQKKYQSELFLFYHPTWPLVFIIYVK